MRESRKNFLAEIVRADVDVNLAIGGTVQIARADDFAVLDEHDGVTGDFDFAEKVGIEEHGGASFSLVANDVANEPAAHRVEAGCGLIEEDEFGLMDESLSEADALQHAFRKAAEAAVAMRGEADEIEISGNTVAELGRSESAEAAMKREQFGGGEPVVKAKILRKETDLAANFYARKRVIENLGVTATRFDETEQHLDGGAFAGAIRAEEAEDLAAADLKRKATNGNLGAEDLAKAMGFDGQVICRLQMFLRKSSTYNRESNLPKRGEESIRRFARDENLGRYVRVEG